MRKSCQALKFSFEFWQRPRESPAFGRAFSGISYLMEIRILFLVCGGESGGHSGRCGFLLLLLI